MSDDTQKDIVDVVKSSVDAAIETKADKAEVEAVKEALGKIEMPSVEGFVKEETVAELKAELEATKSAHEELKVSSNQLQQSTKESQKCQAISSGTAKASTPKLT